jgi:gas vesicle protein
MRKKIFLGGVLLSLALPVGVLASTTGTPPVRDCKAVEARVKEKIDRFDFSKGRHVTAYTNLQNRLSKFVTRMQEAGLDTTKLNADIAVLNQKIAKLSTDYAAFVKKLRETSLLACASTSFTGGMKESRTLLKKVQDDVKDIHAYFQSTIKPDMEALKSQRVEDQDDNATGTERD